MNHRVVQMLFVCLLLTGVAVSQIDSPTFRYATINVPGAASTEARGINNLGEIVGFFTVGNPFCTFGANCAIHGFRLINGKFSRIDIPGALQTEVLGVNDFGDVAGAYFTSDNHLHGFLLHHTGLLQKINQSGTDFTSANGVNNSLTVVGNGVTGFIWKNGTFTKLDITNHAVGGQSEDINGISNLGVIVGDLFASDFFNGWQKAGPDLDIFARINGSDTRVMGTNARDDLVGSAAGRGFVSFHQEGAETSETGEKLKPVPINAPGARTTTPWSINRFQAIVGTFIDDLNVSHGFLAVH